jgi:uncharacterized protein
MNQNERQVIDGLFEKIRQSAARAGPRDREAEALIAEHLRRQPEASYYLAQLAIVQRQALLQAEARLATLEPQRGGDSGAGGFLPRQPDARQPGPPPYAAPPQGGGGSGGGGGGGFLQGAMQTALGIGGGILLANAAMSLLGGMGDTLAASLWDERAHAAELQDAYATGYDSGYESAAQGTDVDQGGDWLGGDSGFDFGGC